MLDMGFLPDVKKILALVPKDKQSLLFSATFSDEIRELANGLLRNPQSIQVTPRNTTVQRITQVIHPVGRGKKKALLAHIIQEQNWSQVLVFTRTKFGANNVAEFLTKNGIQAMALHGNKSQNARTRALGGFKSGEIQILVATDIASRGIDIKELPAVVNFDLPNVPEDYVHRIGRTGRAGADGAAVSLVCLDEEGFMADIERFTKQKIEVKVVEGFGPEPGERAEPIAMGRQTIWGGAGKPPSRDVMAAAAKAARQEMMQRIRDNKASERQKPVAVVAAVARRRANRASSGRQRPRRQWPERALQRPSQPAAAHWPAGPPMRSARSSQLDARGAELLTARRRFRRDRRKNLPAQCRPSPAQTCTIGAMKTVQSSGSNGNGGQPDPMRTSIDSMAGSGRRGGGGRGPNRSGGGGLRASWAGKSWPRSFWSMTQCWRLSIHWAAAP
jgi:ATP-dependent RNA helicase RhlE